MDTNEVVVGWEEWGGGVLNHEWTRMVTNQVVVERGGMESGVLNHEWTGMSTSEVGGVSGELVFSGFLSQG
jgi:hypothetical protein